ncbi:MAG: hypothetical protein VW518_07545 [Burkholderiaceae bacterium]
MAQQTDVKAATQTAGTGTPVGHRARVKSIHYRSTGTAGSIVLKDGGSGGATKLTVNTPAVVSSNDVYIPGEGLLFETDVYCALTNADAVTIFYG